MDEAVVEVKAKTPPITEAVDAQEPTKTEPAAKSKGGRPAGAKDKAPRKKKVVVVVEDLPESRAEPEKRSPAKSVTAASSSAAPAPPPEPVRAPEPVREPEPVHNEPPSPRAIIWQSADHMLALKRLNMQARKDHLSSAYTRGLSSF